MNFKQMWNSLDDNFKKSLKNIGIVFGVIILLFIGIWVYQLIVGVRMEYSKIEDKINMSTKSYLTSTKKLPEIDEKTEVDSSKLIASGYLKEFSKYTNDTGCSSKTTVENNNGQYNYITILTCDNYKTKTLGDVIKDNVAITGAGIYEVNGKYIYKGEVVNNYIKLGDTIFRIVSMDESGDVLLIVNESNYSYTSWDNRYNVEIGQNSGKNDYSLSRVRDKTLELYGKYSELIKKNIIKADWCIDKYSDYAESSVCNNFIKDYAALLSINDYYLASLDSECINFSNKSCNNYNYLSDLVKGSFSLTASSVDGYSIFSMEAGSSSIMANNVREIFTAVKINSDNHYTLGDGSLTNPYIIK